MNDFLQHYAPILAALAAASERLVESIKKLFPVLSAQLNPPKTEEEKDKDQRREGFVSLLSIICSILTAWLAWGGGVLPGLPGLHGLGTHGVATVCFYGLLVAGGSRLWNPIVEWLKAIKDAKTK